MLTHSVIQYMLRFQSLANKFKVKIQHRPLKLCSAQFDKLRRDICIQCNIPTHKTAGLCIPFCAEWGIAKPETVSSLLKKKMQKQSFIFHKWSSMHNQRTPHSSFSPSHL